ncbi:voltage-dependent calcium channel unc-36-like [Macrosteles quadrilineatus]|uniref:voltage-dependent calcium channel unc-36-like n=1 Tax=Macrosteles quadrilineatus TaxID=74068 RepID=UPI0023E2D4C2|nr:voltage-dependent calcium channel unc-36-like [Macrosteles quadrilineatus]
MTARAVLAFGLLLTLYIGCGSGTKEEETVEIWARKLGDELWQLGTHVSKFDSIISSYSTLNARVLPTNGEAILSSIVDNVSKLLKKKMDAVMCIIEAAEALAEEAETNVTEPVNYNSAKCSTFIDLETGNETGTELVSCEREDNDERPSDLYNNITVTPDLHFFGIPISTNTSSVHMPTDIYDYAMPVQAALKWSEGLDESFKQNYESDPSLKWQYFGSSTGFLRMYPALQWKKENDVYDCRQSPWFIEASTCSKDVVILLDRSGSMKGMSDSIAKLAVTQILSTFSNNDFINIIGFNTSLLDMVPCFKKDMLVQATEENIRTFRDYVLESQPTGKANFTTAFTGAFTLLQKYRETKTCPDKTCNQAIMLITDSVAGNLTEVFETYNWFQNRTQIPVRVFTYLIGKEVTKVREIQWMACLNRGYYVHIEAHSEVRDQILKYIPVIARPLVLQAVDHPLSWTHSFIDFKDPKVERWLIDSMAFAEQEERLSKHTATQNNYFSQSKQDNLYILRFKKGAEDGGLEVTFCEGMQKIYEEEEFNLTPKLQEYHLMTSVSGPAFDHKVNRGNESREAQLLGVAGTDVPIKDIEKLTLPYKIGANGYAFMITNNGYMMMHPDFRPVSQGKLRANYGSVDLTEVELMDDDEITPRQPHEKILQLREAMINKTGGQVSNIPHLNMKFHYDDMKRVGAESRNYYFAGIEGTPFTMGLALPEGYGNYWIKAGNIIKRSKLEGVPLTSYFTGNWKVHPDWVYCDHFIARKDMTHEEKLVYFLKKIQNEKLGTQNGWKTKVQFPPEPAYKDGDLNYTCNTNKVKEDEYFCDVELMQLLVFDAKSTDSSYKDVVWTPDNNIERDLVKKYGVSVRFVATQSGLTRWQHITELADGELEFGETNNKAVGEPWYRAAVLQHYINDEDFVFSVPFDSGNVDNLTVTASYAIFRRDGGNEAPGSVVGFHLSHSALFDRFRDVTAKTNCKDCLDPCTSDTTDCYVIDGNGYILVSENRQETGTFFGRKEGAIMEDMILKKIFRKIPMFDYQAICFEVTHLNNAADILWTPIRYFQWIMHWFLSHIAWLIVEANWNEVLAAKFTHEVADIDDDYYDMEADNITTTPMPTIDIRTVKATKACKSCDKFGYLYLLQSTEKQAKYRSSHEDPCHRPYFVRRIPHTNLLLIVVKALYATCSKDETTEFSELHYEDEPEPQIPSCVKMYLNDLPRRRLSGCYNQHPQELEIDRCGRGSALTTSLLSLLPSLWIIVKYCL